MRAVEFVKARANNVVDALVATASTVSESKVSTFAKSAKKDASNVGISLLMSKTVYHAAVKVATSSGNIVAQGAGSLLHGVSFAAGTAGSGAAKGVGVASKKAGEKVQNASNTCSAHITDSAVWVKENGEKAASVVHSVGVSPTVTKATTRTASTVWLLNLVETASRGRLAPVLLKIPVAGPYLAAVSLGGAAAYQVIALACGLSSAFTLAARRDEALYAHRMPYGPSPYGVDDDEWNARCKAHEEAAKMFKAGNKERSYGKAPAGYTDAEWEAACKEHTESSMRLRAAKAVPTPAPDADIKVEDAVLAAVVDEAFATALADIASMTDDEVKATAQSITDFISAVWGEDQPLEDVVKALQDAIATSSTTASTLQDAIATSSTTASTMQDAVVDAVDRAKSNGVAASSDSNA